jgi:hypothetical protein
MISSIQLKKREGRERERERGERGREELNSKQRK